MFEREQAERQVKAAMRATVETSRTVESPARHN
jgi:hypothetical protein